MTYLEIIDTSAKLLALFHVGAIKYDCATCSSQDRLNCGMKTSQETPVFFHKEIGDLYTCPVRMIPLWIYDWWDEYLYETEKHVAPSYNDKLQLQWHFEKQYKTYYDKFSAQTSKLSTDEGEKKKDLGMFQKIASRRK